MQYFKERGQFILLNDAAKVIQKSPKVKSRKASRLYVVNMNMTFR